MTRIENGFIIIEWDDNKNKSNKQKHKVSFELAHLAFYDNYNLTKPDFIVDGEQHWKTLGKVEGNLVLFVGHLYHDDENGKEIFRIITARKATPHEERKYYDSY